MNRHGPNDLKMLQSLPLEAKIRMTKERIRTWYESWTRFEIENLKTGRTRFVTWDTRKSFEPPIKENEWIKAGWHGAVYVSFSGGKDSTVLKHITRKGWAWAKFWTISVSNMTEYSEKG